MPHFLVPSLIAGLLSAAIFVLVVAAGLGFFFLFLPTLPLFWLGLSRAPRLVLTASAITAFAISLVGDIASGIFFLLMLGLPTWYISRLSILSRDEGGMRVWYPLGLVFTRVTLYACVLVFAMDIFFANQPLGLEKMLAGQIREIFGTASGEYAEAVELIAGPWLFLVLSLGIWLWGLALYGHAWFINRKLVKRRKNIRPDYAITIFSMPQIMLLALGLCAITSLFGNAQFAFIGKALLVSLLMPYFFLGVAVMHTHTKSWANRRFFLFFVYFMVFSQFWPALIISGIGLIHHIKRLSGRPASTRS